MGLNFELSPRQTSSVSTTLSMPGPHPLPMTGDFFPPPCQVMPQLLYYLRLDSAKGASGGVSGGGGGGGDGGIDWGCLLVYSCSADTRCCPLGRGYHPEFLWKQEMP